MLFSATLTRDPAKIAALGLRQPKYIVVQSPKSTGSKEEGVLDFVMEKFTMPATLTVGLVSAPSRPLLICTLRHGY